MSVHSVDHLPPPTDDGYRGYKIDNNGHVIERYDHTNESSIHGGASGLSGSRRLLAEEPPPQKSRRPPPRRQIKRSAGCCSSCVGCLITLGRLPVASAICVLFIWIGTGMFIGAGWAVLDETTGLFERFGPLDGNPATDPPPEWWFAGDGNYVLRNPENLGNRVPETFLSLKRAFCGIIPFMFLFSLVVMVDGARSTNELQTSERGCKSSSAGICCSISLLIGGYLLLLSWVFFLAFTTLGVYYYRMVMLRCDDLMNRGFTSGIQKDICVDLVQYGLIMFRSTADPFFGKICGPGDSSRNTVGDLMGYCENYHHAWRLMLLAFAGSLLTIIAMMHALIIVSGNYSKLQRKYMRPSRVYTYAVMSSPATTHRSMVSSRQSSQPVHIVGTNNGIGDHGRRRSRDIELDYMMDDDEDHRSSTVTYDPPPRRRFEKDSHVGIDYYYKR